MLPYFRSTSAQTLFRMNITGISSNWKEFRKLQLMPKTAILQHKTFCNSCALQSSALVVEQRSRCSMSSTSSNMSRNKSLEMHTRNLFITSFQGEKMPKLTQKGSSEITNSMRLVADEWETVYRFQYVRVARVVQRLKLYQTAFTCGLVFPGTLGMFLYGIVPIETVTFTTGASLFACGMLYVMGRFCSRLIGVLYVSKKDNNQVRVAHLNFWGKREDQIFLKKEFVPFSELPDNVSDVYVKVRFYSEPETILYICVRYGTIYNRTEFEDIFGTQSGLSIMKTNNTHKDKEK